jgi:hypothetical protein
MLYGTNRRAAARAKVPMQVIRGFSPTEPHKLSSLAPVKDGEEIYSGMLIVKDAGEFRPTAATDDDALVSFFLALHDYDSHDVQAAGGLVGLDCSDDYEVQTGYYAAGTYTVDLPLCAGADGVVTEADTAGQVIMGYITKVGTGDGALPYVGKTWSTATEAGAKVIQFKTAQNGQVFAA